MNNEDKTAETLKPEDPTSKGYLGVGRLHLVENKNKKTTADRYYYFLVAKSVGRGHDRFLFTEEQLMEASSRFAENKEDSPEPKTFGQILLSGEIWRLF